MTRLGERMRTLLRQAGRPSRARRPDRSGRSGRGRSGPPPVGEQASTIQYTPGLDGEPDPGEVVWAWVPYEDDPDRGKDRPVLLIGHEGPTLLALQLTSQDHDLDAEDEARYGRYWMDIGSGDWDHERRPSEVRLDRLLRLDPGAVRREGAVLDRPVFDAVIREAGRHHDL